MIVENIKNENAEIMKDTHCKKIDHAGIRFKHEIMSCICSIEKIMKQKLLKPKIEIMLTRRLICLNCLK